MNTCENCRHWTDERMNTPGVLGECRKHAPVVNGKDECAHPITPALWTCGDFEPDAGALN